MRTDILRQVKSRLISQYKFKVVGEWLRDGICPGCKKKELFTHAETPWVIKCGRQNKCGIEYHARDLYPEFFEEFNKRYQPTTTNPNATADAYLDIARGLNPKNIKGWYRQEKFWHPKGDKGTATVRFDIDRANNVYMERLVEPVTITKDDGDRETRKAHFGGAHRGLWWQPPSLEFKAGDEIWLVEGCLDAIALNLNGVKAVAILSCSNYPAKKLAQHKGKDIKWVFALDNDAAGKRFAKKFVKQSKKDEFNAFAAMIPEGQDTHKKDWNDLHQSGDLKPEQIDDYRHEGALLVAPTPLSKAMLIWSRNSKRTTFSFTFDNRVFWFKTDIEKLNKEIQTLAEAYPELSEKELRDKGIENAGMLTEICNCNPTFLYYQSHEATSEAWYYCRVNFPTTRPRPTIKTTFTGPQIGAAGEFKKRLLTVAPGGLFTGSNRQLDWIVQNHLNNIKQVKTIDYVGYSKDHQAYIFNDFAVKAGKVIKANAEDYIELSKGISVKTLASSHKFEIGAAHEFNKDWPELVFEAFGAKGLIALTFWFGSLFAEQIRAAQKSFPFLEIVGEPGSGKTTLIEFLWRTFGLEDTEGFDPSKSTFASIRRKFAQVSNMPIVLLEGDRDNENKYKMFDFNQLKDSYNGRAFGERGVKNGGNETYAPAFKGSIVIAQNADVSGSLAVMERIMHLTVDKSKHSNQTRIAADKLNQIPMSALSHFLIKAISSEVKTVDYVKRNARRYEDELLSHPKIKTARIAKNHGQLMALADCMVDITGLSESQRHVLRAFVEDMAIEREIAIKADHKLVQSFWETFEYLNNIRPLDHAIGDDTIAVNLNHFVKVAVEEKQQIPAIADLKPLLKLTRTHKFLGIKAVNSAVNKQMERGPATVKCWVFQKKAGL